MDEATAKPTRRPTMTDVARRAGVSLKTVSRVVNGEQHVSGEMASRVVEAIAALGFKPDRRARHLAAGSGSGGLIGFVQVDAANPFFAAVNRGLEDALRDRDLVVLSGSTDGDPAREEALVRTLVEFRVDGIVVVAAEGSDDLLRHEAMLGIPVVCVDRPLDAAPVDVVVSDNRDTSRAAVTHLLSRGHRRIAFLGGNQQIWTAQERMAGFTAAVEAADDDVDPLIVVDVDAVHLAADATRALLTGSRPPTALFTAQDRITTGAVTALHALGLQHEVALFGYDEIPFAEQLVPTVSVIAQDPYAMGRKSGELLLERLADRSTTRATTTVMAAPLRHRRSGDILPP